ncbi:MAG: hypothetical protein KF841_00455 [Phycisphaerae bacterium]|nr:hypothetical protein [Phycisphaerae bacterium]
MAHSRKSTGVSKTNPPGWLRALGHRDLPSKVTLNGETFIHIQTYKHDFFAGTGLYEGAGRKVVVKIGRQAPIMGIPVSFIGLVLMKRESRMLRAVAGCEGVPECLGTVLRTGLVRAYVPGRPLGREDRPGDEFFPRLEKLLGEIHSRNMAYVDLEKRENVLVGDDGMPHLIDFQISWKFDGWLGRTWPARWMLGVLQQSDRYHLMKHWRRLRPDQLDEATFQRTGKAPFWIAWHRRVFRPFTLLRRRVLVWLGARETAHGRSPG